MCVSTRSIDYFPTFSNDTRGRGEKGDTHFFEEHHHILVINMGGQKAELKAYAPEGETETTSIASIALDKATDSLQSAVKAYPSRS